MHYFLVRNHKNEKKCNYKNWRKYEFLERQNETYKRKINNETINNGKLTIIQFPRKNQTFGGKI